MSEEATAKPAVNIATLRASAQSADLPRVELHVLPWDDGCTSSAIPGITLHRVDSRAAPVGSRAVRRAVEAALHLDRILGAAGRIASDCCLLLDIGKGQPVPFTGIVADDGIQFLHVRGVRNGAAGFTEGRSRISVVTGICLFGSQGCWFIDDRGDRVNMLGPRSKGPTRALIDLYVDDDLSTYERESAIRLSRSLARTVALAQPDATVTVTVNIPQVQYYFYLLTAYAQDLIDTSLLLRWFDAVDRRHHQVVEHYSEQLRRELRRERVDFALVQSNALDMLRTTVRDLVTCHEIPDIDALLQAVSESDDSWWQTMMTLDRPKSMTELSRSSYVLDVLRSSTRSETGPADLVIQFDNYSEWRILHGVHRFLDRIRQAGLRAPSAPILGLYPMERLLTADTCGNWGNAYFNDPGRYAANAAGMPVDLGVLIDSLYAVRHRR
ncbi:hypothetical protein [Nocardia wallacei]|uniref:hypothetical protein n=1 Tax=Nocardia wallacei TaxID=480035 RepID=UPI002458BC0D|nr:hypothetical protein [Nocardia wallacei]